MSEQPQRRMRLGWIAERKTEYQLLGLQDYRLSSSEKARHHVRLDELAGSRRANSGQLRRATPYYPRGRLVNLDMRDRPLGAGRRRSAVSYALRIPLILTFWDVTGEDDQTR